MSGKIRVGPRAEQKRRWDRENPSRCACGAPCSRGHYSLRAIAFELHSTKDSIGSRVSRMRSDGWDLPYRNPPRP